MEVTLYFQTLGEAVLGRRFVYKGRHSLALTIAMIITSEHSEKSGFLLALPLTYSSSLKSSHGLLVSVLEHFCLPILTLLLRSRFNCRQDTLEVNLALFKPETFTRKRLGHNGRTYVAARKPYADLPREHPCASLEISLPCRKGDGTDMTVHSQRVPRNPCWRPSGGLPQPAVLHRGRSRRPSQPGGLLHRGMGSASPMRH